MKLGSVDMDNVFPAMQKLYTERWSELFRWSEEVSMETQPRHLNEALINGATLQRVGQSTAVEYWRERSNNFQCVTRIDRVKVGGSSQSVSSDFFVMQSQRHREVDPCMGTPSRDFADDVVALLTSEGSELENVLLRTGIVTGSKAGKDWTVNVDKLAAHLKTHCVVMHGHFPCPYWPKFKRITGKQLDAVLCSRAGFVQHAGC